MLNESWTPKYKLAFRRRHRLLTLLFHYTVTISHNIYTPVLVRKSRSLKLLLYYTLHPSTVEGEQVQHVTAVLYFTPTLYTCQLAFYQIEQTVPMLNESWRIGDLNINWSSFHQRTKENTANQCEKYASSSLYEINPNIVEDKQGQQVTNVLD